MKNLGYYNGKIGLIEEISIPITDRAFYFGDGVYDAVMCRNNIPYLLWEHIDRFYNNCDTLSIVIPITKKELYELICSLVIKVDADEKFVYFHVSRGSGIRSHTFEGGVGNLCITVIPQSVGDISIKIKALLAEDIRYKLCNIKTLNLLPSVLAAQMAKEKGCDETIFYRNDFVTEGSHCNVSIIKDDTIINAPTDCYILPGVVRSHLIKEAKRSGIRVEERRYGLDELFSADEIMISSSGKILRGVESLDGMRVGGKNPKLLSYLQNRLYSDYIKATS